MAPNKKVEPPKFLAGWKEIAIYLDKGVRTVQRYEREMGLPVRRPAGKSRAAVLATRAELDAWVAASPIRDAFKISRPAVDGSDFATDIAKRVAEMRVLRDQMAALRNELRGTVDVLRETIIHVHTGLTPASALSKTFSIASFDYNKKAVADLVGVQSLRKAN
jgi:hypothetical protein